MAEPKRPEAVSEAQTRYLKAHPACAISGIIGSCDAHHIIPYSFLCSIGREDVAEMPEIFITLATPTHRAPNTPNWHEAIHLLDFESFDPDFEAHLPFYMGKTLGQVKADPVYQQWVANRPLPARKLGIEFLSQLKAKVDSKYPKKQQS